MKKKVLFGILACAVAASLCACGNTSNTGSGDKPAASVSQEEQKPEEEQKEEQKPAEEQKQEETPKEEQKTEETPKEEEKQEETVVDDTSEDPEAPENQAEVDGDEGSASEEQQEYPGDDVVKLVNLRGDTTTAYKLADGTYMDRVQMRFTYDGEETWTDEDGVEWNMAVE